MGETTWRALVAAIALAAVACQNLPDVRAEECGNLVLDFDEDCDGSSQFGDGTACGEPNTANECAYICDADNGVSCPDGWVCGGDQRCRRHSGSFEQAAGSPHRFDVDDFAIGDVNGDGHLDVIGQELGDLRVLFGDDAGGLETEYTTASGLAQGPMTVGNFTNDGRSDVVLPLIEGVSVFLGANDDSLEPVLFAPFSLDSQFGPEDVLAILPFESVPEPISSPTEMLLLVDAYDDTGAYEGSIMAFFSDNGGAAGLPGGHKLSELAGRVPVADVDADALGRSELALAFKGASSVWLYTSTGGLGASPLTPFLLQQVSLGSRQVRDGALFGDFDGDGDLDLIVSVSDAGTHKVMVSLNDGAGSFGPATLQPIFNRGFGSPFPLAVGNFDGSPHADYVYPEAIYLAGRQDGAQSGIPDTLLEVAQTQAVRWNEAVFGDFNGDGRMDIAASFVDETGVDVFINSDTLYPNRFRVATTDQAKLLRVGDFDGDLMADVAFVQRRQGETADGIYVVYGGPDGPGTDAVSMGKLGGVESFEVALAQTFFLDGISDLYVISRTGPQGSSRSIALLQGSSARRLSSPFTLTTGGDGVQPDIPFHVFVGQFDMGEAPDIVAIADIIGSDPTARDYRLWALPGAMGEGGLKTEQVTSLDINGTDFDAACAAWTSGDLDGDGVDEIIGVDGSSDCPNRDFDGAPHLIIGRNSGGGAGAFEKTIVDLGGDLRGIAELTLLDLDNDGDLDVLARFVGDPTTIDAADFTISKGGLMVLWNDQGSLDSSGTTVVSLSSGAVVLGAAAARLSTAAEPSLIVVTIEGVYTSTLDPDSTTYATPTLTELAGGTGRIAVGDLDNDGLDDIAYVVNRDLVVMLGKPAEPLGASQ